MKKYQYILNSLISDKSKKLWIKKVLRKIWGNKNPDLDIACQIIVYVSYTRANISSDKYTRFCFWILQGEYSLFDYNILQFSKKWSFLNFKFKIDVQIFKMTLSIELNVSFVSYL